MNESRRDLVSWWREHGLDYITPQNLENPEGFNVAQVFEELAVAWKLPFPILDFGCGRGRLAGAFAPSEYFGIDVNPNAVELAKARHPEHAFAVTATPVLECTQFPGTMLAYSVFLHLYDDEITSIMRAISPPVLLLVEIMRGSLAQPESADGFVQNQRNLSAYLLLLEDAGYEFVTLLDMPVEYYKGQSITFSEWRRADVSSQSHSDSSAPHSDHHR